ncbi:hypothetical protein LO771_17315 [Streptacidiphilus sp. ASG 303]|uniref:WXG100 family type VII secretion target n=1 Tax=Streptacidiphilus sp. ASG 303 TaxID=2896847 RepID=UPI001E411D47|nr:hypothetical protein [Streptacidiphilus sp. ASG 303]MCD0484104.1 hypothetical protein [Streptacidiphilus sp. ASG 303]
MATYSVVMNSVEHVVGEMDAITKLLKQTLTQLDESARAHLAEWDAATKDAYAVAKNDWDTRAEEMRQLALIAHRALGEINDAYSAGERAGTALWNS